MKTGTVEIRQHVETTPTVSKSFDVGSILISKYDNDSLGKSTYAPPTQFVLLGKYRIYKFIGKNYVTASPAEEYTASSADIIVEDKELITYLRDRARTLLGAIYHEIEDGILDD